MSTPICESFVSESLRCLRGGLLIRTVAFIGTRLTSTRYMHYGTVDVVMSKSGPVTGDNVH